MKYGYVRSSLNLPHEIEKQRAALEILGVDEIIVEKSNRHFFKKHHKKLKKLLKHIKPGDSIHVTSPDRLTRYKTEFNKIALKIKRKGAELHIVN